ncbi:MAG: GGDEF domain-containing protein [Lachnospiraceae bacterium]
MNTSKKFINKNIVKLITVFLTLILTILVILLVLDVNKVQGNARVINYAGIVRGATQRLIKLEITNNTNDELLEKLDQIIYGLQTGSTELNLIALDDVNYQNNLSLLIDEWELLKDDIYDARIKGYENTTLLERSETYFYMADDTVAAAEIFSEQLAIHIRNIEYLLVINIVIILIILFIQTISSLKITTENQKLNTIAHLDVQTKIPNKLSCDLKLASYKELPSTTVFGCAMFDLNNLKKTNDSYGHTTGDTLIIEFAKILRSSFPDNVFVGRYGGDEFIAIFEDMTHEQIDACIKTMKKQTIIIQDNYPFKIEFAYGYVLSNESDSTTLSQLLQYADARMYTNKIESKK